MPTPSPQDMVGKALSLLTSLGNYPRGTVASELGRESGLPLSTAHRLLGALVREGYVEFDQSSKRYTLALRVFQLAQSVLRAHGLTGMARPILEEVSATTREATLLAVRDGERQLYVFATSGPQQVQVVGDPGKHGPLHCTSQGKVLVAFAPDDVRDDLLASLSLTKLGPNSITRRSQFRREIARVRSMGYAVADEEHESGIRAISVPVFDGEAVAAALSTAAPAYRTTVKQLVGHLQTLHDAAGSLASLMTLQQDPRLTSR